jgi:hypothetical protein
MEKIQFSLIKQNIVCEKLTDEIMQFYGFPKTMYHFLYFRLRMAFGTGYDAGWSRQGRKSKPIMQLTKQNKIVNVYDSVTIAAHAVGARQSNLSRCARGVKHHKTCKGGTYLF